MQKDLDGVIAVVGMAGRFPGSKDLDRFDAGFFGINHREAEILDPQQRVFLEVSWEALEDAGYDPDAVGMTGVFAGQPVSSYLLFNLLPSLSGTLAGMDPLQLLVGNAADSLATRVSYKLNLKGPSFTVQSPGSTLALAVHLARQSLLNGECDLALAGSVSVDARSPENGEARVYVLKRADEALRDGDNVQGLVTDSAADGPEARFSLEPAPEVARTSSRRDRYALPVSARTEEALERACQRLADWLEAHPELDLGDVEYTLTVGRRRFEHVRVVECRTTQEAIEALRAGTAGASPAVFKEKTAGEAPAVPGKRVSLPTYPFERRRYWIEAPGAVVEASAFHPRPALFTPFEVPRDEAEAKVAAIWQEVLGVAPVGAHDDFFQLGGHSLLAPQILARVRDVFGVDFPLQHVFSFPTPAELAEAIRFLQQEGPPPIPQSPLREAGGPYPLSFSQERLWFIDRLEPGNPIYNEPRAAYIEGRLDVAALEASLREIVQRQEALRTTFHDTDGAAVQVVSPYVALHLPIVDLGGLPEAVRSAEAGRLSREEARRPFDLSHGPMLRTLLLRLGPLEHLALFTVHHIASDGWSLDLLVMELTALYGAFSQGLPSPLPPLPIQYADFAEWQRQWLQGEELEKQVAYWREALAGVPTVLELPTDRPRPAVPSYRGSVEMVALPGLAEAVDELGRGEGASRFMTLLAAFQALLHRLSGQDDLLVGSPVANRTRPEIEGLVGFFVNLLALRARFDENLSFRGLLGQVRDACLAAYEHQDLPFEKLVEAVEVQRDISRPPLFQVLFALQSPPLAGVELPGLTLSAREVHAGQARFDLTLAMLEQGGDLTAGLEHSTDLFDAATARRWLGHLHRLIAEAVTHPDLPLDELELLTAAERAQIAAWSGRAVLPAAAVEEGVSLHGLFAAQAARTPDAVAVSYEGRHLSYRELDRWANGLAHRLRELGAERGAWVGICTERSPEMVVAVVAVLKTGAAYVPLDPDYPRDRLAWVLEDAGMAALLVGPGLEERMRELGGGLIPTFGLHEQGGRIEAEAPPESRTNPDDAAYMIYTSGSTGRPKGVMVTHANAVRLFTRTEAWFGFGPGDVWTLFHSYAFDFSVWEIWGALLYGGRLVVVPFWVSRSPEDFYRLLVHEGVTFLNQTPSAFGQLMQAEETLGVDPGLALRHVVFGGEALNLQSLAPWWQRHAEDRPRLVNMYGITETTVHVTYRPLGPSDLAGAPGSWIGTAIPDLSIHVLDRRQRPVPVGVAGELCVGGAGLARGYHNRPELTAARFIPDPFGDTPGSRLYRSGDLARWRPTGELEYLGRIDHQVKIRGFRIELGEIEAALTRHPEVAEARVLARTDRGEARLVTFVVPRDVDRVGDGELIHELRSWLRQSLPEYMVPSAFGLRDALPLTPNGKVDMARLLREEIKQEPARRANEADEAPKTEAEIRPAAVEAAVVRVWQDVLGVDEVGLDDNFFDLGGHSLLLQRLCSRLRQDLDPTLKLADLFRHPTVREQARLLHPPALETPEAPVALAARPAFVVQAAQPSGRIAIVGMAGRFPGAADLETFWRNLRDGVESVRFLTAEELAARGADPSVLSDGSWVPAVAMPDGYDLFDARFFGMSAREAEVVDPQQRLLLEVAWEALEDAGYDPREPGEAVRVSTFAGASASAYLLLNLASQFSMRDPLPYLLGNVPDSLATRISYKLDLKGQSYAVQSACSTSLVAIHSACRALLTGECDMALAGGVALPLTQLAGYAFQEGSIASPDGHCRAFDAGARGTLFGGGAGMVVLKRLEDALAAGDTVRAVILGSAVNNDGALKMGFTAPGVEGQEAVIREALAAAGAEPSTISYVEAHGTGTEVGDPIEVEALGRALGPGRHSSCAIGSVKTNFGHLDAAAGVAGVIKTVLALEHREIPPSLHFETPNPAIDLESSRLHVNARLAPWTSDGPRRAGVSSFGMGGTNAHLVLEEAPPATPANPGRPWQLLVLSARSADALEAATDRLARHLREHPDLDLADVAWTLQAGRRTFRHRRAVACRDLRDAAGVLAGRDPDRVWTVGAVGDTADPRERPVAFLLSGQGSQYPGMGRKLYETEEVFRAEVDRCAEILRPHLGLDVREVIWPGRGSAEEGSDTDAERLQQTAYAQPALFVFEYALARLWMSWGVRPSAMLGHSLGEYVAACLAEVFTLEEALALVAVRGRLMQELPGGCMTAVPLPESEVLPRLGSDLSVAAVNEPARCVVSGPAGAVEALERALTREGIACRRLHTSHAFHSAMMEPILERFREELAKVRFAAPRIPFLSNLTGTWITAAQVTDPGYWVNHLRGTVRFADGVAELLREPGRVLLEVGPGNALTSLARRPAMASGAVALASVRHPQEPGSDVAFLLTALGRLWLAGLRIDWRKASGACRRRVPLPTYPFERERYWVERVDRVEPAAVAGAAVQRELASDVADWFYVPVWKQSKPAPSSPDLTISPWLIFADAADAGGIGEALERRLTAAGATVALVRPAPEIDYEDLIARHAPGRIVHLWSLDRATDASDAREALDLGFFSLLRLARGLTGPVELTAVTRNVHEVTGEEERDRLSSVGAAVLGVVETLPQEAPGVRCRAVDLGSGTLSIDRLLAEMAGAGEAPVVALRGAHRWVRTLEPVRLPQASPFRDGGVYLITGGMSGLGLRIAQHLAHRHRARLVLVGRRLREVTGLEGSEVLALAADVADRERMREVRDLALERFGAIHGVIHAAGVAGGGLIAVKTREAAEAVLAPKVLGALVLDELFPAEEPDLDFLALFSSVAGLVSDAGQVDYCGANAFLDSFAHYRNGRSARGALTVAIDWDAWQEIGMAVDTSVPEALRALRDRQLRAGIPPDLGVEALERALAAGWPQVAVSRQDLPARVAASHAPRREADLEAVLAARYSAHAAHAAHARPELATAYVPPSTEAERRVAGIWQDLLGVDRVGVHDDFFELGGDSLIGIQLVARLRQAFGVDLPLREVFEVPRVTAMAGRLAQLGGLTADRATGGRRHLSEAPASFAQERLWFLERLEAGSPAYSILGGLRMLGRLDRAALARAFGEVVRRHDALRTVFVEVDGAPVQRIRTVSELPPSFLTVDLTGLPEGIGGLREHELRRLAAEETRRPFDLEAGPLLRTFLLRLEPEDHAFLFLLHHIVGDGWSLGVIQREVAALYGGAHLPELTRQYADYVLWQRRTLQGDLLEEWLGWWQQALAGAPTVLELPLDRPRPAARSDQGETETIALPAGLAAALREAGRQRRATLFMVLLAGFQALLHRITGQDDLLVGSPIAGRTEVEQEQLVGFFVNTLVFRSQLDPVAPGFGALVERLRDFAIGAYAHQDMPFERLVEALQVERSLAFNPLFQVSFALQNVPTETLELPGLTLEPFAVTSAAAKFDLGLELTEGEAGIDIRLEYAAELFDRTSMRRLLEHFRILLEAAAADPELRVTDLPLITPAERQQLLADWNDSATEYPRQASIHELFDEAVERAPDAVAAVFGEESCTWRELQERANRLANHLLKMGVGPGSPVAIYLERSLDMVVSTLATLKAGGAYVPLDTSYPEERLAFMLEDSGAPVLITLEASEGLFASREVRILCLDRERSQWESASARKPEVFAAPESLAYLIYTSGSTGRPKGVAVPHRAVIRLVRNTNYVDLRATDVMAQASNTSFDAATLELWGALLNGARLVGVAKETLLSPAALAEQLRRDGVTVLFLTTSLFHQAGRSEPGIFQGLRYAIAGGEALDPAAARQVLRDGGPERLLNGYGPTESTTFAAWHPVAEVPEGAATVPIGRPLANTELRVLDRNLEPVPVGSTGELLIGGDGLAWGYLNRPDLTAERFVPDPFGSGGARLYHTGDLVRQRPDGVIEYLGRADGQVKIRGFRIEPGEVEAALNADPAVREAVVLVDGEGSEKRLVAYVVTSAEPAELRERLAKTLPAYMVPAAYVRLDALPLTPNGKADRRALAKIRPDAEGARSAGPVPPRTGTEERLAAIWVEVLGVPAGALDDFFESGGHSLMATRLVSRVRETFGVELPLRAVFEAPVLADMAARIDAEGYLVHEAIVRQSEGEALPLSFAQERLWFLDRLEPGSASYNVAFALRLTGAVDVPALERGFEGVVRRHDALRTTIVEVEGEPRQVVSPPGPWTVPVVDLEVLPEDVREAEARRLAAVEAGAPFDLGTGPLLRTRLLRLTPTDWRLLVTLHHIVSDGWSMGVLVREAVAFYRNDPLPELPIQYADYAVWQRGWLGGEVLDAQVRYWTAELAGAPEVLELPSDRPRPAVRSPYGAVEPFALDAGIAEPLHGLARPEGATVFMVLLAAFQAWLHRYSGQPDILVGTPVANRGRKESEGLIGLFVNTLVMRGRIDPPGASRLTFRELLSRARSTALAAYAHQDLPFERLVEELGVERSLSHTPLFQTMLALQNTPVGALTLPELTLEPIPVDRSVSTFDLSVSLAEEDGEIRGGAEYSLDLFDAATMRRLLGHLRVLIEAAVREPGSPLSELPLLTAAEIGELRALSSGRLLECRPPRTLHPLIEEQAARNPEELAVLTHEGETLTYAQLDREADRLAGRLRALGVGPDVPVGVYLHRSPGLVVSLLGVLKAGGAYLPLDPGYPDDRLAYILEDSGAPVVVTAASLSGRLAAARSRVVLLDGPSGDAPPYARPEVHPENLAYIIYTSGSTGRPKGTGIAHGPAVEHMEVAAELFGLAPGERMLQFVSPGFDVTMEEMLPPLLAGATVVPTGSEIWPPERFLDRLADTGVTTFDIPTAYWHHWVREHEGLEALPPGLRLRFAAMGGEAMQAEVARLWFRTPLASIPLVNTYGPTEAIVTATALVVDERLATLETKAGGSIPLGPPLAGRGSWILDPWGGPVPVGVVGELYLGGPMLARGYLHRPELTAERFVPDPFAGPERPGARLYRTGDLVRRLPSGQVEFVGRTDQQIKIRGFRIELGEIEAALGRLPGVVEAVVLARDGRLAAFVAAGDPKPQAAELRAALARELPDYMVPSAWAVLGELPLSPNGKVDRRALARLEAAALGGGEAVAPRTPAEALIAGIWTDLLGLRNPVSVHDSFFELGGHSLLATRLVSRVREAFGVELPLRAVFEAPVLADMTARIEALGVAGGPLESRPVVATGLADDPGRGPLSFAQERLWFLDRLEPGSTAYNIPAALRVTGALDPAALAASLSGIVRRHAALRTTFEEQDGGPVQVIHPPAPVELPVDDLRGLPEREAEAARCIREDVDTPFDLARGPLLRARLLRLEDQEWLLILTVHHIVSDGWSTGVLVRESAALYEAFVQGLPSPLPELPIQYLDFAVWQRLWLRGEALESQLRWWRGELAGAPALLELPTDRPRPAVQSYRGASEPATLPAGLVQALHQLARHEGATLFMVLLAGFQTLLHRYSDQDDVLVGSPVANRVRSELEDLIGFFVNTLVLRGRTAPERSFRGLLQASRDAALGAYAHQDVPFEKLVEGLGVERSLAHAPLFQVMLALQNVPMGALALPGVEVRAAEMPLSTAKFDLTLEMTEVEGGLESFLNYAADLFDRATVRRLLGHFEVLLEAAAADPDARLADLPLLTAAETAELAAWNRTEVEYPDVCLHELIEAQAEKTPDAVAVVFEEESLTFRELDEWASALASELPATLVGISVERSLEMVVGLLAILKAGGAYVPIDPGYPAERVAYMIEDSGVSVLLDAAAIRHWERSTRTVGS